MTQSWSTIRKSIDPGAKEVFYPLYLGTDKAVGNVFPWMQLISECKAEDGFIPKAYVSKEFTFSLSGNIYCIVVFRNCNTSHPCIIAMGWPSLTLLLIIEYVFLVAFLLYCYDS